MSENLSKETFEAHIGPIREDIATLVVLLREQNSRVSKSETRIAVLEERTPPSRLESNGLSAVISGLITGIGLWLSQK